MLEGHSTRCQGGWPKGQINLDLWRGDRPISCRVYCADHHRREKDIFIQRCACRKHPVLKEIALPIRRGLFQLLSFKLYLKLQAMKAKARQKGRTFLNAYSVFFAFLFGIITPKTTPSTIAIVATTAVNEIHTAGRRKPLSTLRVYPFSTTR